MIITDIKQQQRRKDRYSVYVDNSYSFSLSEGALLEQGLATGQELDPARLKALTEAATTDKAYGNALRYVAMRPRSIWEVRSYLQRKAVDEPAIEGIVKRLVNVGLLDDASFAKAWVASRQLLKQSSKRRLRMELLQKRVEERIIDAVLNRQEAGDRDNLRVLLQKKRSRYPDPQKLMQYLARQGFSYDDIKTVMQESVEDT